MSYENLPLEIREHLSLNPNRITFKRAPDSHSSYIYKSHSVTIYIESSHGR